MIESLCARQAFVRFGHGADEAPVIGTVERYQVKLMETPVLPPRRPSIRITEDPAGIPPFAADASRKS